MVNRNPSKHDVFKSLRGNKFLVGVSIWVIFFVFVMIVLELII